MRKQMIRSSLITADQIQSLKTGPTFRFWGKNPPPGLMDGTRVKPAILAATPDAQVDDGVAKLRLYDPIDSWGGPWGISAKEFVETLDKLDDSTTDIHLHINSPGGEVFEALAILNALRNHPATVTAIVDGLAASAASFIAAGAEKTIMGRNTELMIHDAWGLCIGNAEDMHNFGDLLGHLSDNVASVYAEKSGDPVADWRQKMLAETWYSAQEAVDAGLADEVEGKAGDAEPEPEPEPENTFDLTRFVYAGRDKSPAPDDAPATTTDQTLAARSAFAKKRHARLTARASA